MVIGRCARPREARDIRLAGSKVSERGGMWKFAAPRTGDPVRPRRGAAGGSGRRRSGRRAWRGCAPCGPRRSVGDAEALGDVAVVQAIQQLVQHLALTGRQRLQRLFAAAFLAAGGEASRSRAKQASTAARSGCSSKGFSRNRPRAAKRVRAEETSPCAVTTTAGRPRPRSRIAPAGRGRPCPACGCRRWRTRPSPGARPRGSPQRRRTPPSRGRAGSAGARASRAPRVVVDDEDGEGGGVLTHRRPRPRER